MDPSLFPRVVVCLLPPPPPPPLPPPHRDRDRDRSDVHVTRRNEVDDDADADCIHVSPYAAHPEHPARLTPLTTRFSSPSSFSASLSSSSSPSRSCSLDSWRWSTTSTTAAVRGDAEQRERIEKCLRALDVHDSLYLDALCSSERDGGVEAYVTPDTYVVQTKQATWRVLIECAAAVFRATELATGRGEATESPARVIFVPIRPPGHHASRARGQGFCLLNWVVLGARYAQESWKRERTMRRHDHPDPRLRQEQEGEGEGVVGMNMAPRESVVILDIDVHHGNGTEECVRREENIWFVSMHRYDNGWYYPGSGHLCPRSESKDSDERIFNIPLWPCVPVDGLEAIRDEDFVGIIQHGLLPILRTVQPKIVFVSTGFDFADGDPIGGQAVSSDGFRRAGRLITHCCTEEIGCSVVYIMEGGYDGEVNASCAQSLVEGLQESADPTPSSDYVSLNSMTPLGLGTLLDFAEVSARVIPEFVHLKNSCEELLHVKFKEYGIDEPQYNLLSSQELYPPLNEEESEMLQLYHNLSLSQFLYPGGPCMARLPCRSGSEKNSTKELEWVYARIVECSSQQDEKQGSVRVVVDESVDGIPPNFEWHVCVSDMCLRPFSLDMVIEPHPSYTGLYTMNTRQMLQLPTEVL